MMSQPEMKLPLTLQYNHLALSALWNIYGVYLISQGLPSQGPTASLSVVGILALFGLLFFLGNRYSKYLYLGAALLAVVIFMPAIIGVFTKDPTSWTSPAWRWGGLVLNLSGVLGALLGITRMWRGGKRPARS